VTGPLPGGILPAGSHADHDDVGLFDAHVLLLSGPLAPDGSRAPDGLQHVGRMKPLLRYVGKLTLTPAKITPEDAQAVLAAGWHEQALHDAVAVCGLFNMMNRMVEGWASPRAKATSAPPPAGLPTPGTRD